MASAYARGMNPGQDDIQRTPVPAWAMAIIAGMALLQPAVYVVNQYALPEGAVATGLHIPDSALFLHAMELGENGPYSPYATCRSEAGEISLRFYSVPHLWLYVLLGTVAEALGMDHLLFYSLANGMGAGLYLWVVLLLLRTIAPGVAHRAFLLFCVSAGPGGVLYLLTGALGWHKNPGFETYFTRFALYDLFEGPHLNPVLYFPRCYYTISLALCLGGLRAVIRAMACERPWGLAVWAAPIAVGSFINARYGCFALAIVLFYLLHARGSGRLRAGLGFAVPMALGFAAAWVLMGTNPAVVANHREVGSMAMWFSPFIAVAGVHLLLAFGPLRRVMREAPVLSRLLLGAGAGYLAAYALGYVLYQGYYGGLLAGRDGSVSAAISDWALLGTVPGMAWAWWRGDERRGAQTWLALWLVGFLALSISGFAGGRFLALGPQRLQVFLWLPLCLFAAMGIEQLRPPLARTAWTWLLANGVVTVLVAVFLFQTSVERPAARGPFATLHAEAIAREDAALLDTMGDGTVLTPAPMGDVVVRLRGNPVVFGIGSFNLSVLPYAAVSGVVNRFFDPATPDEERREIARDWCVDYVLCPTTWPVPDGTPEALRGADWLEVVSEGENSALFKVRPM